MFLLKFYVRAENHILFKKPTGSLVFWLTMGKKIFCVLVCTVCVCNLYVKRLNLFNQNCISYRVNIRKHI